jgi:hypothetical protein
MRKNLRTKKAIKLLGYCEFFTEVDFKKVDWDKVWDEEGFELYAVNNVFFLKDFCQELITPILRNTISHECTIKIHDMTDKYIFYTTHSNSYDLNSYCERYEFL